MTEVREHTREVTSLFYVIHRVYRVLLSKLYDNVPAAIQLYFTEYLLNCYQNVCNFPAIITFTL